MGFFNLMVRSIAKQCVSNHATIERYEPRFTAPALRLRSARSLLKKVHWTILFALQTAPYPSTRRFATAQDEGVK